MFPEAAVACGSPEAAVASVQAGASSLPLARSERIKVSRWMTRLAPTFAASRRGVLCAITAGLSASFSPRCSHAATTLSDRFDSSGLLMPPLLSGMESLPGDLRYPGWLAGTWRVTNTNSEFAVQREALSSGEELGISFLELLTKFERPAGAEQPTTARASYKVLQYLSSPPGISRKAPSSRAERALEREAAGRAVAILNYDLLLERVDS